MYAIGSACCSSSRFNGFTCSTGFPSRGFSMSGHARPPTPPSLESVVTPDTRCVASGEEARYGLFHSHGRITGISIFTSPSFPDHRNLVSNTALMSDLSFSAVMRSPTNRTQLSVEDRFISTVDRLTYRGMWHRTALFGPAFPGVA